MHRLNLPEFDVRLDGEKIFCLIRKKWIVLTPEEWVRQHFINLMINHLGYPKGLIRLEQSMKYFKNAKRSDIVLLDREAGNFMVVECKATTEPINQKVMNQVAQYNKILESKYIAVSNGLKHFIWEGREQLKEFPKYE